MVNNVVLVGRITKDAEVKKTSSGKSMVAFAIAVERQTKGNDKQVDFISCQAWEQSAIFMGQYVKKGNLLALVGRIQTRNYQDQSGKTVYVTEVVCDRIQKLSNDNANDNQASKPSQEKPYDNEISEEDLPF